MRTWMELLCNSDKFQESDYDRMDSFYQGLLDECRISKLNDMEKEEYNKNILEYEDVRDALTYEKKLSLEEGFEKGMEKGVEKGRAEGLERLRKTAKRLLGMGMPIEDISAATGLPLDEIAALK